MSTTAAILTLTKNKKCNAPCGLAGTTTAARRAATHHSHRRILQENQMKKIGLDSDENLFLWEKKNLWKVLFNPKRILILQKLQTFLPWQIGICINGHVTLCFFQKGLAKKAGLKLNSDNKSAKSISFWWQFWGMTFFEDVTRGRAVCQRKRDVCVSIYITIITFGGLRKYLLSTLILHFVCYDFHQKTLSKNVTKQIGLSEWMYSSEFFAYLAVWSHFMFTSSCSQNVFRGVRVLPPVSSAQLACAVPVPPCRAEPCRRTREPVWCCALWCQVV